MNTSNKNIIIHPPFFVACFLPSNNIDEADNNNHSRCLQVSIRVRYLFVSKRRVVGRINRSLLKFILFQFILVQIENQVSLTKTKKVSRTVEHLEELNIGAVTRYLVPHCKIVLRSGVTLMDIGYMWDYG